MNPAYISHHGIKGQKWGIRRWQNPDGTLTEAGIRRYAKKNLKKSMNANLEKFGIDQDHNVLYITGLSGSGKSTLAIGVKKENDELIHLDSYTDPDIAGSYQNANFNKYLDKKYPGLREKVDWAINRKSADQEIFNPSKEYFKSVDSFAKAIEEYGSSLFLKEKRVIAEGVQIFDKFLRSDSSFYKDKPVIITTTNWKKSLSQKMERDNTPEEKKEFWTKIYLDASSQLTEFEKEILIKKGKTRSLQFLRR